MSVTVGPRRATPVGLTVPTDPDTPLGNVWVVPRAKKASFSSLLVRRGRKPASAARPHGNPSDARDPTDTALRGLALPRASPRLITIAPTYTIPLNGHVTRSPIFNEARFREWTPFTTAIEAPSFHAREWRTPDGVSEFRSSMSGSVASAVFRLPGAGSGL
jgi:hypothetical protein